jgi:hydroxymethylpyrimidine pyrophosphatase-like HAD family hydrolase
MQASKKLLLIDLDGVLVTDGDGDTRIGREILIVHPEFSEKLKYLNLPVAVVTHRTRREADQILAALNISNEILVSVYSANDIVLSALAKGRLRTLLQQGSLKSLVLSRINEKLHIQTSSMAFIDDRIANIEDMHSCGVGMTIHVPKARLIESDMMETFNIDEAIASLQEWCSEKDGISSVQRSINLKPVIKKIDKSCKSGIIMKRHKWDFYGMTRHFIHRSRLLFR